MSLSFLYPSKTIDEIIAAMPYKELPPISGRFTLNALLGQQKLLAKSAMRFKPGRGPVGHLYKAEPHAVYSIIPYVPPADPGYVPTYPPGADSATIRNQDNIYAMNRRAKVHDKTCDEALITIFKCSIEPEVIKEI